MLLRAFPSRPCVTPSSLRRPVWAYAGGVDGREDVEPTGEQLLLGSGPFPPDARRLGIDRFSDDGALIAFAANLDPDKPAHKLFAWFLLAVMVAPLALTVRYLLA